MKQTVRLWIFAAILCLAGQATKLAAQESETDKTLISVDSVLIQMKHFAPIYEAMIAEYRANLYTKGELRVSKRNFLLRYAPFMFRARKGVRDYLIETYNELHYTAPNIFDRKVIASYGTVDRFEGVGVDIQDYMHINVYSTALLTSEILSPIASDAHRYYTYTGNTVTDEDGNPYYRLEFRPKKNSSQLVEGYMIISTDVWSIREMYLAGRAEYLRFTNRVIMGEVDRPNEFLPTRYDLSVIFDMLGNQVESEFSANLDYTEIRWRAQETELPLPSPQNKYDLTRSFTLQTDTTGMKTDSLSFDRLRPIPLTDEDRKYYEHYTQERDSLSRRPILYAADRMFWSNMGDALFGWQTIYLNHGGQMRMSPIIDPSMWSYSRTDGFVIRQNLRFNRLFSGDRLLQGSARLGYNFLHKEFHWRLYTDFYYWPRKRASAHLRIGNGNRIYNGDVMDNLKAENNNQIDFDSLNFTYFRDFYIEFLHRVEPVNGLTIDLGFAYHRRTTIGYQALLGEVGTELTKLPVQPFYTSMSPHIVLSWTPGQYYYMSGDRKVNLHSRWPTFSLDWGSGLNGVLGSSIRYQRWELDVQHKIQLGLLRTFSYRLGAGIFTDQSDELYFVDFVNFAKNNLPVDWNDEIGGVFQLLDRRWYNSSRRYLCAHASYESPSLALTYLKGLTRNITRERIYLSGLLMPHLQPYLELGYGFGTRIFNVGVFINNINGQFSEVGAKFTFELFK
ncbi:MAG: DUF5686 family protein [Prevotellaceae bacterium]|jgi:hypothetical protein|nr:DUF5686 family protein [Prevotellaceae bacterium]